MSQRQSGYERKERDLYETPEWVTRALAPHIPERMEYIWEPAAGSGKMAGALMKEGFIVHKSDVYPASNLHDVGDFFQMKKPAPAEGIITNPPYEQAQKFIERALELMSPNGFVAMLLRVDFDSAKTRKHLFEDNPHWARKIVLTDRIRWFEGGASPSFNHAWFLFDHTHSGPPTIHYAGKEQL